MKWKVAIIKKRGYSENKYDTMYGEFEDEWDPPSDEKWIEILHRNRKRLEGNIIIFLLGEKGIMHIQEIYKDRGKGKAFFYDVMTVNAKKFKEVLDNLVGDD